MAKVTNSYKREQGLTIEQLNAIDLLITGKTDQEVADEVRVNRVTVTKWRNYDIYFQAELNKRRKGIWSASLDKMRALVPKAMERLEKEIDNENGWKIALEVIKIAGIENRHINGIGHDDADKILSEEAQKRLSDELSTIGASEYSKQEILKEYQKKIEE
jgi:hypothetical protein